jgi:hypothetical protein
LEEIETSILVCFRNEPSKDVGNQVRFASRLININVVKALRASTNEWPTLRR